MSRFGSLVTLGWVPKIFPTPIGQPCVKFEENRFRGFPGKLKSVGRTPVADMDQKNSKSPGYPGWFNKLCVSFPQPHGPDLIVQSTSKTLVKSQQIYVATDGMLGISLIWTICHKLMWFYRNAVLFYIILLWGMAKSLVIWRYRYFDSKQNGAADRGISGDGVIITSIERNTIAIESKSFAAGITATCLAYGWDW